MPLPKRRHSNARTGKRRSHHALTLPGVVLCPNCHAPKLPHRACGKCGQYRGRTVVVREQA